MGFGKTQPKNPYDAIQAPFQASLYTQMQATETTAQAYDEQARLIGRETTENAKLLAKNANTMNENNSLGYSGSGVLATEGSPIAVAREIAKNAAADIRDYYRQGVAAVKNAQRQAYLTRVGGRADILGSMVSFSQGKTGAAVGAVQPSGLGMAAGGLLSGIGSTLLSKAFMSPGSGGATAGGVPPMYNPLMVNSLGSYQSQLGGVNSIAYGGY